jgi:hypothetical protein
MRLMRLTHDLTKDFSEVERLFCIRLKALYSFLLYFCATIPDNMVKLQLQ